MNWNGKIIITKKLFFSFKIYIFLLHKRDCLVTNNYQIISFKIIWLYLSYDFVITNFAINFQILVVIDVFYVLF